MMEQKETKTTTCVDYPYRTKGKKYLNLALVFLIPSAAFPLLFIYFSPHSINDVNRFQNLQLILFAVNSISGLLFWIFFLGGIHYYYKRLQ